MIVSLKMHKILHTTVLVLLLCAAAGCSGNKTHLLEFRPAGKPLPNNKEADAAVDKRLYESIQQQTIKLTPLTAALIKVSPNVTRPPDQPKTREHESAVYLSSDTEKTFFNTICLREQKDQGRAAAANATPLPAERQGYSLHLSSHRNFLFALQDCNKYSKITGQTVFLKRTDIPGTGTWYRLYVGIFDTKDEAYSYGEKMRLKGVFDYFAPHKTIFTM